MASRSGTTSKTDQEHKRTGNRYEKCRFFLYALPARMAGDDALSPRARGSMSPGSADRSVQSMSCELTFVAGLLRICSPFRCAPADAHSYIWSRLTCIEQGLGSSLLRSQKEFSTLQLY